MSNANKEQEALKELEAILDETRPKNLLTGILSGTGYIVGGGLGAVGIAVLGPVKGATDGALNSGVLGGVTGLLGGTVVGFMQAVNVAGGGESLLVACFLEHVLLPGLCLVCVGHTLPHSSRS
jgi:uncharacterized membrane protein